MIFKQYYLGCLSHASYIIADEGTGTAVIVDPQRDIDQYVDDAKDFGLQIKFVFLTHFHADFVAGHLELRDRTGAQVFLGAQAKAEFEALSMSEQEFVSLVTADQPEAPQYFVYDAVMNRKERQTLEESLQRALKPLSTQEALRLQREGAQLLDIREPADYEGAHIANSLNIGPRGQVRHLCGNAPGPG